MYFELTRKKISSLGIIAGAMLVTLAVAIYANGYWSIAEKTVEAILRAHGELTYQLIYKSPWSQSAAVGYSNAGPQEGNAEAIPVLIYHGTPPEGNDNPPLPQSVFVDQLRALKADGWKTITLKQFEDFMKKGTPVPAKSFLLTFDDGRKESFYPTDPVLKDLGYTAVMFTITGFSFPEGGKHSTYYLNQTELQYMIDSGRWEIESHGHMDHRIYDVPSATPINGEVQTIRDQHFLSNRFWLPDPGRIETEAEYIARVTNDLKTSNRILEEKFGKKITSFAFPFNDYGQESANFQGEAIADISNIVSSLYTFSFYQIDPKREDPFNYPDAKAYMIKRIEPIASWSGAELVEILDSNAPKPLPYTTDGKWSDWSGNWGSVTKTTAGLLLKATPKSSGAAALINGSRSWDDYSITATVDWVRGSSASLIARYQSDSKTFLSCAFSDKRISVKSHQGGKQQTLATVPYTLEGRPDNTALTMSVKGGSVTCGTQGVIATASVGIEFVHPGSAGVQIWDATLGNAQLTIRKASISAL